MTSTVKYSLIAFGGGIGNRDSVAVARTQGLTRTVRIADSRIYQLTPWQQDRTEGTSQGRIKSGNGSTRGDLRELKTQTREQRTNMVER